MNYYEHHLGDYLRDTAHLTMLEDGAYRRLIDAYYIRGRPLPADLRECCKLARAISKPERDAVASVLREFFTATADGHAHKRCDVEIERYLGRQPAAAAKRESDRDRQRRSRERRKALFDTLRDHGVVAPWDASTDELQAAVSRATNGGGHAPVTCDNTASHSPVPSPHLNLTEGSARKSRRASKRCPEDFEPDRAFAEAEVPDMDVDREVQKFRDYEFARARSDWAATWRSWVRKARDESRYTRKPRVSVGATVVPIWGA